MNLSLTLGALNVLSKFQDVLHARLAFSAAVALARYTSQSFILRERLSPHGKTIR